MPSLRIVLLLLLLCSACAGSLPDVPAHEPHGTLRLRIVHAPDESLYEDTVQVDLDRVSVNRPRQRDVTVRLRPGWHFVELRAEGSEFELGTRTVTHRYGACIDPECRYFSPTREVQTGLVEGAHSLCMKQSSIEVVSGRAQLALLVVGADKRQGGPCALCLVDDLSAERCP